MSGAAASASVASGGGGSFPDELIIRCVRQHSCLYDPRETDYKDADRKSAVWREIASSVGLSAIECEHRWRYLRDRYTRERKRKSQQTNGPSSLANGKSNNGNWPLASQMHFIQDFIKHRSFKLKARRGARGGGGGQNSEQQEAQRRIKAENEANNATSSGDERTTDEPPSPGFDQQSGAECYAPMVIIEESDGPHQLVDHSGPPGTPASDFRTAPDRRSAYGNDCPSVGGNVGGRPASPRLVYNEDELFCLSVAQTLRRLPLMRRSLAKVQILQLIHDMEFGHS